MTDETKDGNAGERLTFSAIECARILGVSRATVYEAIHNGTIPSLRIGGRLLVPRSALTRMLDNAGAIE